MQHKPLALIILDGWGHRASTDHNAIAAAKKPIWDSLWERYPHTLISASGKCVGLPDGQMGNSEVGHMNIGAGRIVYQDLTRIDEAIASQMFFKNATLTRAFENAKRKNKAVHILGLLSPGGVHSHENHLHAIIQLAAEYKISSLYIHAFLDGRDMPPKSALPSIEKLLQICKSLHTGEVVSLIGRFYAMDRDKRWERIQKTYELLTEAKADFFAANALHGLEAAYARGETDEFVKPTCMNPKATIQEDDTVIFMNFRADRAREITSAFVEPQFTGFTRHVHPKTHFVTLTEYDVNFNVDIAFPPERLQNIFPELISQFHLKQLRIAETEKYAHVTFFFNGGKEQPYPGETRILIPSPKITTYDLQPEMSALEMTERLILEIESLQHDVIICNFANPDMLGHTGNINATVSAIETIDECLGKIIHALHSVGGEAIITADHGNAEMMFDEATQQAHTAHTSELVPFIYIGRPAKIVKANGILSDIAPTMLYLMELSQPKEMTGKTLVEIT